MKKQFALVYALGMLAACTAAPDAAGHAADPAATFSGERAFEHLVAQVELGPRFPGSPGQQATVEYLSATLERYGWAVEPQSFEYAGLPGINVIGRANEGVGTPIVVAAHFDTRQVADEDPVHPDLPVPGANDGASGVAVLLELARTVDLSQVEHEVWLVFFDHEDQGRIDGRDWIAGSTFFVAELDILPEYAIIVDMIGDADQQVYYEFNSDIALMEHLWRIAGELGYGESIIPTYRHSMLDDHSPFIQRGVPSVLMIDFDYPYWHTLQDTPDQVSPQSLERIGRTLEQFLEQRAGRYPANLASP